MEEIKTLFENEAFSEETIKSVESLSLVLKRIKKRMNSEGFEVVDGEICKKSIM